MPTMQANVERSHTDECPASGAAAHNGRPPRSLGRTDESACARERGGRCKHLGRLVEGHPRARAPAQGAAADRRQRSAARAEAVGVWAVLRASGVRLREHAALGVAFSGGELAGGA